MKGKLGKWDFSEGQMIYSSARKNNASIWGFKIFIVFFFFWLIFLRKL